jgi:ATP-binding cassette, subfamily B, bacterial
MPDFDNDVTPGESEAIRNALGDGEYVLTTYAPDLNLQSQFESNLVVLTNRRFLYRTNQESWNEVEITPEHELTCSELAGVQTLELRGSKGLSAAWRSTLSQVKAANELRETFAELKLRAVDRTAAVGGANNGRKTIARTKLGTFFHSPLFRLLTFARARLKAVLVGFMLTLVATGVSLIPPYLTMPLVDDVLVPSQVRAAPGQAIVQTKGIIESTVDAIAGPGPSMSKVAVYLVGLAAAAILAWLLAWGQGFVLARVSERISADLRNRTYAHLQKLSLEYFGDKRTGDLISRISNDSEHLCSFLSDSLVDFVTDILMIIGSAIVLVSLDPWLAVATLASFPIIASLILRVRGRLTHGFLRTGRAWSAMTNVLADTIPGIRVVKAFAQEQREAERFAQSNQRIFEINDRINALWTFFWPLVGFLNQLGLLVVWAVGAWEIFHHRVTIGVLTAFIAYIGRFYARLESMSRMLTITQKASAGAQRIFEILDRVSTVAEPEHPKTLSKVVGALNFEDISFRYGSRIVVDHVSFDVAAGEMVGIVGHTGSGKSSIANLACRFYDVTEGTVRIDGVDVRDIAIQQYRKNIGIVLQDPFLFFGSIAENVSYGEPGAAREKIMKSARVACAHEFILRLADGYDSLVGERGQSLSGGERQRIAIARAVLIDPKILILDEATSAVDAQTEREIQRALDNVVQGRTTIAIAHRLSTLRKANKLVVLNQGRLAEMGNHAELLAKGGEYARLYQAQMQSALGTNGAELAMDNDADFEQPAMVEAPSLDLHEVLRALTPLQSGRGELQLSLASGAERVHPVRCFPLTEPGEWIALVDERGREVAMIPSLESLTTTQRELINAALNAREFVPIITAIDRIVVLPSHGQWHVSTNRGATRFTLGHEDHVRALTKSRFVVSDLHGMRYVINDSNQLDSRSRRLLSRYL